MKRRDTSLDPVGFNTVPTPRGRLVLTGKRYVAPDPDRARLLFGSDATVVCLNPEPELREWPRYPQWLRANQPESAVWFSIPDWTAASLSETGVLLDIITERLSEGRAVIVHCSLGQGRAGTIGIATLMRMGIDRETAIATVAEHRAGAGPASWSQSEFLKELEHASTSPHQPEP